MPNRLLTLILLIAMVSSNLSRFFVYAGFEANKAYITATLCINKSRPWMHCNGRCYLAQKIKQTEEKEKKQERETQKNRYHEVIPVALTIKPFYKSVVMTRYPSCRVKNPVKLSFAIFHPPQFIS